MKIIFNSIVETLKFSVAGVKHFALGIVWALVVSVCHVFFALKSEDKAVGFSGLSIFNYWDVNATSVILAVIADFVIFTIPAFLVFIATNFLVKVPKYNGKKLSKGYFQSIWKLLVSFTPAALFYLIIYMLGAIIRGDVALVSNEDGNILWKYLFYLFGVVITSFLFGFRDLYITTKSNNEKFVEHQNEIDKLKKEIENKDKKIEGQRQKNKKLQDDIVKREKNIKRLRRQIKH